MCCLKLFPSIVNCKVQNLFSNFKIFIKIFLFPDAYIIKRREKINKWFRKRKDIIETVYQIIKCLVKFLRNNLLFFKLFYWLLEIECDWLHLQQR